MPNWDRRRQSAGLHPWLAEENITRVRAPRRSANELSARMARLARCGSTLPTFQVAQLPQHPSFESQISPIRSPRSDEPDPEGVNRRLNLKNHEHVYHLWVAGLPQSMHK